MHRLLGSVVLVAAVAGCGSDTGFLPNPDMPHGPDATGVLDMSMLPDINVPLDFTVPPDMATGPGPDLAGGMGPKMVPVVVGPNGSLSFSPQTVTVRAGDTVQWTWASSGHNVVSGLNAPDNRFCSPNDMNCAIAPRSNAGFTYSHTFNAPGTFPYFCAPHRFAGMTGTVTVQ